MAVLSTPNDEGDVDDEYKEDEASADDDEYGATDEFPGKDAADDIDCSVTSSHSVAMLSANTPSKIHHAFHYIQSQIFTQIFTIY